MALETDKSETYEARFEPVSMTLKFWSSNDFSGYRAKVTIVAKGAKYVETGLEFPVSPRDPDGYAVLGNVRRDQEMISKMIAGDGKSPVAYADAILKGIEKIEKEFLDRHDGWFY